MFPKYLERACFVLSRLNHCSSLYWVILVLHVMAQMVQNAAARYLSGVHNVNILLRLNVSQSVASAL